MKTIGVWSIVKNEVPWIGFHVLSLKDVVREFVYFDSSTDGTTEILEYLRDKKGLPIKLFKNRDVSNLKDHYVEVSNEAMGNIKSDFVWFCHPDMWLASDAGGFRGDALAYFVNLKSIAGEPGGDLFEFTKGRSGRWKAIMANKFGLHYNGHYGSADEDMYFRDITGNAHTCFEEMESYPFEVKDSGLHLLHFSDVRTEERRLQRMVSCLLNQHPQMTPEKAIELAKTHPRVTLDCSAGFKTHYFEMKPFDGVPEVFYQYADELAAVMGKTPEEAFYIKCRERV